MLIFKDLSFIAFTSASSIIVLTEKGNFFQMMGDPREQTLKASPIKAPKCGLHTKEGLAFAVVKDKSTQEGEWPHTCLMYKMEGGKPEYFGGATLIAAGVLITAAHELYSDTDT